MKPPGAPSQQWLFSALALLATAYTYFFIDLTPHVGRDFFFATDDPELHVTEQINRIFPSGEQIILSVQGSDIRSLDYGTRIHTLSLKLMEVQGVASVKGIRHGPKTLDDAFKSPLWRRLLISEDASATNIIVILQENASSGMIRRIEVLANEYRAPDFEIAISGVPYINELIRRHLLQDLKTFALATLIIFSLVILLLFRSLPILIGILVSCLNACFLTLIVRHWLGIQAGPLTPNLSTIVFILCLSHIVFLTANWKRAAQKDRKHDPVSQALRWTGPASFWAMVTTLLGFLSLLPASAQPLRTFGISGALGALVAMASAYLVYPAFLRAHRRPQVKEEARLEGRVETWISGRNVWAAWLAAILLVIAVPGLRLVNTDPSLFDYFEGGSEVREGLQRIDYEGGSSPLQMVVADASDAQLNNGKAFERLWQLQQALENDPSVGVIISLPVVMAEADRPFFSFLVSWEGLLERLEEPKHGQIARSFVTEDRQYARFLLRMHEDTRDKPRTEIVEHLESVVRRQGFTPVMTGGVYLLQGKLSEAVTGSLVTGLIGLLVVFFVVISIVSRSWWATLAALFSLALMVVTMLGSIGSLRMPLDIISATAANVALAIGIDDIIHLMHQAKRSSSGNRLTWTDWDQARHDLWKPILASSLIVCAGFSIFALSNFPPTQRFGISVVIGSSLTVFFVFFVLPLLAASPKRS